MSQETFIECGCCGHWHRADYWGDCRNDTERFTTDYVWEQEEKHNAILIDFELQNEEESN